MAVAEIGTFDRLCKHWRKVRRLSQLDLALAADVSQRHVSWLETGRAKPSRDMVAKLSDAMEVPLRERNALLQSAGFAPHYRETDLDDPSMTPVLDALDRVLEHHEPLPAFVIDRMWNVHRDNPAARRLLQLIVDSEEIAQEISHNGLINIAYLTVHPQGLRSYMVNWNEAAPPFLRRLRQEAASAQDPALGAHIDKLMDLAGDVQEPPETVAPMLPVLPMHLRFSNVDLQLFSMITTIGTPLDITAEELRLEAFYPADSATEAFFRQ